MLLTFNMCGKGNSSVVWDYAAGNDVRFIALQEVGKIETGGGWTVTDHELVSCVFTKGKAPKGVTAASGVIRPTGGAAAPAAGGAAAAAAGAGAGADVKRGRAAKAKAGKHYAYVHVNWASPKRVDDLTATAAAAVAANPRLPMSDTKTRAKTKFTATKNALAKASDSGTHCNMGLAIAWDGKTPIRFYIDRLGDGKTSERPVVYVEMPDGPRIFNVHLSSGKSNQNARAIEIAALLKLAKPTKSWIAVGDFNQEPAKTAALMGRPALHAKRPTQNKGGNLDYAIHSNTPFKKATVILKLASDHWAVLLKER